MKIRSMELHNYRCFKDFNIAFDERLTVLVGINGAGKTATLDALSVFLKWAGSPKTFNDQCRIDNDDVTIGCEPESIIYRLKLFPQYGFDEDLVNFDFKYDSSFVNSFKLSTPEAFHKIKSVIYDRKPLFVGYMAGRHISEEDTIMKKNTSNRTSYAAFDNNFKRNIDYASTLSWFNYADADEARAMRDNGMLDENPELVAVRAALIKALHGKYDRPRMIGDPPELIIYEKGIDRYYKVNQLSDGYRVMLALVMDLARRMAQIEDDEPKTKELLLNKSAIVLIDEVELHLHPAWQQTVLTTLMDIFPNTQFIVTTHSPQVLTSIHNKHIRILSDGKAYTFNEQTEGAEASQLLKRVFRVEIRPKNLNIVKALKKYTKLVYDDKWDTKEATRLRKILNSHYGYDDLELSKLDLHIENKKWESGL